ncbi:hypothetical protein Baya_14735 [Bagarius yarrelli]|uniref:Uncharacterized protein n=1 Tax=Bagarius yarrelli TaxID=175774 RepID=A0A556V9V5_BAGYA|nr:hypothetical protein Baya_14735 [Bagarius yarrelli]
MEKLWNNAGPYDNTKFTVTDPEYHINIEDHFQNVDLNDKSFTDMTLLKKEQKDADLDKRIEAMRKKNEALIKRYQEVEEDKKRAEQEGMAMHSRKSKVEDLTITINKSPSGKRVVSEKVEKSSYAGLAGIKPSTEGRTEPPETSARRTDCLNSQVTPGTSLEEFLEELDALCNPEVNSRSPDTEAQKAEFSSSVKIGTTTSYVSIPTKSENQIISIDAPKNTSSFREAEKKVRFSDDLIQGAYKKNSNTDANDVKASTFKSLPPTTTVSEEQDVWQDLNHDHEGILLTDPRSATPSIKELEHRTKSKSADSPCASVVTQNSTEVPNIPTDQNLLYTKEPLENNTSINTDELMDSSLSVLSLESTESLPVYSTNTEKDWDRAVLLDSPVSSSGLFDGILSAAIVRFKEGCQAGWRH